MADQKPEFETDAGDIAAVIEAASRDWPRRRRSLHEDVAGQLREMVLEGQLAPGSRLPETRLCQVLGISRTPLREAFKVLAKEGLVRLLPHRGALVTDVTVEEVADLFEVMASLEQLVGRLAAQHATDNDIREIEELHRKMVQCYSRRRRKDYFRLNQTVHRRLAEIAGNSVLSEIHATLSDKVYRARALANRSLTRWKESVREHEAILNALRARDADCLGMELSDHVRCTGTIVLEALQSQQTEFHGESSIGP